MEKKSDKSCKKPDKKCFGHQMTKKEKRKRETKKRGAT